MRGNRRTVVATLFTALVALPAWAGLIHEDSAGHASNAEGGCIAPDGSRTVNNVCDPGRGDLSGSARPPITFPQDEGMSLKSLGINNADELGILYNGGAPQGGQSEAMTIKLYSGTTLVMSITGTFSGETAMVNGRLEYLFNLDANSIGALNAAIAGNLGDTVVLDSTNPNGDVQGYSLVDINSIGSVSTTDDPEVPEPATLWLLASALLALGVGRSFRDKLQSCRRSSLTTPGNKQNNRTLR
jgi:hypothetical protein